MTLKEEKLAISISSTQDPSFVVDELLNRWYYINWEVGGFITKMTEKTEERGIVLEEDKSLLYWEIKWLVEIWFKIIPAEEFLWIKQKPLPYYMTL